MSLVLVTAPATEPVTVAEVMARARIDASNQEPAPGAPTAALISPAAAGNVDNGAHRYLVTFVTADGETQAGTPTAAVTVADKAVNGKVSLTSIPLGGSAVTARKLYRTLAGGSVYYLLATLADNTTTIYTDNTADSGLGAGAPSTNTTTDPVLNLLIASTRRTAEQLTGRALVTQTWDLFLDAFPCSGKPIIVPKPTLQSVTSITYTDTAGDAQVLATDQYAVDIKSEPGRIMPAYGVTWPSTRDVMNAVTVRFVAGYGAAAAVPQGIKDWMLARIATALEHPSGLLVGVSLAELPRDFVDGLLDPYRVFG